MTNKLIIERKVKQSRDRKDRGSLIYRNYLLIYKFHNGCLSTFFTASRSGG